LSKHQHRPASVNHLENDPSVASVRHQQPGENDIECETGMDDFRSIIGIQGGPKKSKPQTFVHIFAKY